MQGFRDRLELHRYFAVYAEHCRAVEKMDLSGSALAQHAWEHDNHIDWMSACILDVESNYTVKMKWE